MQKVILYLLSLLILLPLISFGDDDIVIGKKVKIISEVLGEERTILVYLPRNYENTNAKYPVLYVLDGGGHFHHLTGIVDFLSRQGKIPRMIIVGITNVNRNRDFLPSYKATIPVKGSADRFNLFLKKELLPFVNDQYRTHPYNIIIGHSYGGTFATYSFLTTPDLFDGYICISPALWFGNNVLIDMAKTQLPEEYLKAKQYYMTVGNEPDYFPSLDQFQSIIQDKNPDQLEFSYEKMLNESHGSIPHLSMYYGLEFLFSDWSPSVELYSEGIKAIDNHYKQLSIKYGYKIEAPEGVINRIGYVLLNDGNIKGAIKIFKTNVERFPESANVYDSLGDAYEKSNKIKLAKENYEEACKIAVVQNHPNLDSYLKNLERAEKKLNELKY